MGRKLSGPKGLCAESSGTIGFVKECFLYRAISRYELDLWCYLMVEKYANPPSYLWDLMQKKYLAKQIDDIIGFTPRWPFTKQEKIMLYGIAANRNRLPKSCPYEEEWVIDLLNIRVEKKFLQNFPFVSYPRGITDYLYYM